MARTRTELRCLITTAITTAASYPPPVFGNAAAVTTSLRKKFAAIIHRAVSRIAFRFGAKSENSFLKMPTSRRRSLLTLSPTLKSPGNRVRRPWRAICGVVTDAPVETRKIRINSIVRIVCIEPLRTLEMPKKNGETRFTYRTNSV